MPCKANMTQWSQPNGSFTSALKMKADLVPNALPCHTRHHKSLLWQERGQGGATSPEEKQPLAAGKEDQGTNLARFLGAGGHRIYSLKKNNLVNYFKLIYHSRVSHKKRISILFHFEAPSGISTGVHSCTTAIKNKAELCFMDNLFRRGAI